VQERERGHGMDDAAAVLLDVGIADREMLPAGAHTRAITVSSPGFPGRR
jgi:hypothetical protein